MKKEVILLFLIMSISLVSAIEYSCPDSNDLQSKTDEISEGSAKTLINVPLGICGASQNSIQGWIEAQVFIDARLVTIQGTNTTEGTELVSGNTSISYGNPLSTGIKIKLGGVEEQLELNDCISFNNHVVMLKEISSSGTTSIANVLVGRKKETLNSQSQPGKIFEFESKKYAIQLLSGSHIKSTIKISTCNEGDIIQISTPEIQSNQTNTTINNTTGNQNNQSQTPPTSSQNQSNESSQGFVIEPTPQDEQEKGFLRRLWEWVKGLFVKD